MGKRKFLPEVKPIEKWTAEDWERAYNNLNARYDKLKNKMRLASKHLSEAQVCLTEAVI